MSVKARFLATVFALGVISTSAFAQDKSIVVASTTSTQDSGLFGHILPLFKSKTGIEAKVVAQGTGQALDTGRRGDADVVFVHARSQEEKFVADGFGVTRFDVMYNDFVLIGPKADPARIKGSKDIVAFPEIDRIKPEALSYRAAIRAGRTLLNWHCGRLPNSTRPQPNHLGIARSDRVWARLSTQRAR